MPAQQRSERYGSPDAGRERTRLREDPRSPAAWLVLALVIEQPSHGYEINQRYERRFGSFLSTSVPRVYAALDRLREAGMIEPIELEPAQPARKQHRMRRSYRATEAGVAAHRRWVAERLTDDPERARLLARIASTGLLGADSVLEMIDAYEEDCMRQLKALPVQSDRVEQGRSDLSELTESLVIDQQRRELRARYEWAEHARRALLVHRQQTLPAAGEQR